MPSPLPDSSQSELYSYSTGVFGGLVYSRAPAVTPVPFVGPMGVRLDAEAAALALDTFRLALCVRRSPSQARATPRSSPSGQQGASGHNRPGSHARAVVEPTLR